MNVSIFPVNMCGGRGWVHVVVGVLFAIIILSRVREEKSTPAKMNQFNTRTYTLSSIFPTLSSTRFNVLHPILTYQEQPAYQQREPSPSPHSTLFVQTLLLWGWNVCFIKSAIEAQQWPLMFDCVISIIWLRMRVQCHGVRLFQSSNNRQITQRGPADNCWSVYYNSNRNFRSTD